jgi:hypothetical protein
MKRWLFIPLGLLIGSVVSAGCAAVGLTLLGVGAGVSAGTGTSYTLDSITYKTFTASEEELKAATLRTLTRMEITVQENEPTEAGRRIGAVAGDRTVEIELDRLTGKTTRMRVTVKQGWFFRDRATATEIIVQTARTLDEEPVPARKEAPAKGAAALKK